VVQIIDNGDSGFSTVGAWIPYVEPSYQNDIHYAAAGNGSSVASWTFVNLSAGIYRVSATWSTNVNRATNSPFTVLDGSEVIATKVINQEQAPNDLTANGANWEDLGSSLTISSGTLVVRLSNAANEFVIADAVRIERIGEIPSPSIATPSPSVIDDRLGTKPAIPPTIAGRLHSIINSNAWRSRQDSISLLATMPPVWTIYQID